MEANLLLVEKPILIVDDEILIALHLQSLFEEAGAKVFTTTNCEQAFAILEDQPWAGAVLDWALEFEHTDPICEWLVRRHIPFIMYTAHVRLSPICTHGTLVPKPAAEEVVVLMQDMLSTRPTNKPLRRKDIN
jgi:DNA-binding NtrC family response regulator